MFDIICLPGVRFDAQGRPEGCKDGETCNLWARARPGPHPDSDPPSEQPESPGPDSEASFSRLT